jgi:hypothetical protein
LMLAGLFGEQVDGLRNMGRHTSGPPGRGRDGTGGNNFPQV